MNAVITYQDLAEIIGGIYYGLSEDDLSNTEDLISYLEDNGNDAIAFKTERM